MKRVVSTVVVVAWAAVSVASQGNPAAPLQGSPDVLMMQAVFRISGPGDSSRIRITGTGFLIERPNAATPGGMDCIAVTAAHVFRQISGDQATFLIQMQRPDGKYQRLYLPVRIRQKGAQLWTELPSVDLAVMHIPPPKGGVRAIPFDMLATDGDMEKRLDLSVGDSVHALGYPFGYDFNDFPAVRSAVLASYPLTPASVVKQLVVDFLSVGGDSGGPVYTRSKAPGASQTTDGVKVLGMVAQQILSPDRLQNTGLTYVTPAEFIRQAIGILPSRVAAK
jgi:hypothetical protein